MYVAASSALQKLILGTDADTPVQVVLCFEPCSANHQCKGHHAYSGCSKLIKLEVNKASEALRKKRACIFSSTFLKICILFCSFPWTFVPIERLCSEVVLGIFLWVWKRYFLDILAHYFVILKSNQNQCFHFFLSISEVV